MALTKIDDRGLKTPIDLLDNEKIRLGTGNDLELFHDGTNAYLDNTTGSFYIRGVDDKNILIQAKAGEHSIICREDGAVEQYHDNVKRFETISTGVNITGGMRLGGNNAANELDDYETGSWTPDLRFGGATTGITYATDDPRGGRYVKIGRQVTLNYSLSLSNKGSASGVAKIFGIPFTVAADFTGVATQASGLVGFFNNIEDSSLIINLADDGDDSLRLRHTVGAEDDPDSMNETHFSDNTDLRGSITYFTDQ